MYKINLINVVSICGALLFAGCEKQLRTDDKYNPEHSELEVKENKNSIFFPLHLNDQLHKQTANDIDVFLRNSKSSGVDNINYMIISDHAIELLAQERLKNEICSLMRRRGFLESRILFGGLCVYKNAKTGIRIDALKYDVKSPDCSEWEEYIGDTDTNKNLPKFGIANTYNFSEMIDNKADIISPRDYTVSSSKAAVSAINSTASTEGSSNAK